MQRVLPAFLIVLLVVNIFGFYISFYVKQQIIYEEMGQLVKKEAYQKHPCFSLTEKEYKQLSWVKKGKEFLLNGTYYDVAGIEINDTRINVFVIEDEKETDLVARFTRYVRRLAETDKNNSSDKTELPDFLQEYVVADAVKFFALPVCDVEILAEKAFLMQCVADHCSPPPDLQRI